MSEDQEQFSILMQRVREGSQEASQELLDRYGSHILRVVRRKLNKKLRSKFDSHDFVQAVWASFFASPPARYTFDRPEALVAFLGNLARNKVVEVVRQRFKSLKYNVNKEISLDGSAVAEATELVARQPTPSQVAVARECWDRLLEEMPPHQQRMLVLLLQGSTRREIAQELGIDEKTVRRALLKLLRESRP